MIWFCALLSSLLLVQFSVLWYLIQTNWKNHTKPPEENYPKVSVLVAARDEGEDLPKLLKSMESLDYPVEKLEILVADDQSQDHTR